MLWRAKVDRLPRETGLQELGSELIIDTILPTIANVATSKSVFPKVSAGLQWRL
jgi:hypothetical protein